MSETTLNRDPAPTVTASTPEAAVKRGPLVLPFIGYLLYFVGIGQIAGGVVHYPIDPSYFTMMAGIGVLVFLAGTWLNEVILPIDRPSAGRIARLVSASVVLSIGVGGVSGGVQHFLQFPQRSSVLIAAGLVIAFLGFIWKGSYGAAQSAKVGAVVAILAAAVFLALQPLSSSVAETGGDHHHGSPDSSGLQAPTAGNAPAAGTAAQQRETADSAIPGHSDGESGAHGH